MNEVRHVKEKIWLSSPTMHGEEMQFIQEAFETKLDRSAGTQCQRNLKKNGELCLVSPAAALVSEPQQFPLALKWQE